ncbi:MAG: fluoride efflux transporter CrcB [Gemmatimonadaceae bacterium]|nr:fluoride efflux transporter CrcB [Gemmatimonadaceae bacterium]
MYTMRNVLLVALGGGVGSALRAMLVWGTAGRVGTAFPLGVLLVNVLGCFVFGVAIRYGVGSSAMSDSTRLLITTGFCGGFTTFSAFSMDILEGLEQGRTVMITTYVCLSVILGVLAMVAGMSLAKTLAR